MARLQTKRTPAAGGEDKPEAQDQGVNVGEVLFQWDFPLYHKFERGLWWYAIAVAVVIGLLVFSYFTENPFFAIIIILALLILFLNERGRPEYVPFAITETGVLVDDYFFPYDTIKNFFIIYQPPAIKTLYIEPKAFLRARMAIPLDDQDPNEIRKILLEYLDEDLEKEEEPASDTFGKLFKF